MLLMIPISFRRACGIQGTFALAAAIVDTVFGRTLLVSLARDRSACFAKVDEFAHPLHPAAPQPAGRVWLLTCFGVKYALTVAAKRIRA
jgi:hypothetical protein